MTVSFRQFAEPASANDERIRNNILILQQQMVAVDSRLTITESDIALDAADVVALDGRLTTAEGDITTAEGAITALDGRLTTAEGDITTLEGTVSGHTTSIGTNTSNIALKANIASPTFTGNVTTGSNVKIGTSSMYIKPYNDLGVFIASDSVDRWRFNNTSLSPEVNNDQYIGSPSLRVAGIYSVLGNFSGTITSATIVPDTSGRDLGQAAGHYSNLYAEYWRSPYHYIDGNVSTSLRFYPGNVERFRMTTHFYPNANNTSDLGLSANRFANVYGVLGNFSGTITSATIVPDGAYTRNLGQTSGSLYYNYLYAQFWESFYHRIDMNNTGAIRFQPGKTERWRMDTDLYPSVTNTSDIGTSALRVKTIYTVNAVDVSSDITLKKNIIACPLGLDFVSALTPVKYAYLHDDDSFSRFGVVAQNVLEKLPEEYQTNNSIVTGHEDGTYSMAYQELIGPLIQAIKDLKERVVALEAEIKMKADK